MIRDMTQGSPSKIMILFTVPMILGNLFQQLYNIVDSVVVGNYVGPDALAAVGASSSITFLFIAIATGSSIGCSVVISQFFGAKRLVQMKTAVYTALTSVVLLSLIMTVIGLLMSGSILRWMSTPDDIMVNADIYLRIYLMGLCFMFLYNICTAAFNGLGDSRTPLYFLIFSSITNIVLDLLFVLRFHAGVEGVAWATLISQGIASLLALLVLFLRLRKIHTEESSRLFDGAILVHIGKVAIPSIIQQSIVSVGIVFVQALVNRYGTNVVAGYTAATKIDSIAIVPMINIGNAVSAFTAQNIGAKQPERVKKGLRAALLMVFVIGGMLTASLYLFGGSFVGLFVDTETNQEVIAVGIEYLRVVGTFYVLMGSMASFNGVLRGSGDMRMFMFCTLANFFCRVAGAYALSALIGEAAIWWSIPLGWLVGLLLAGGRFLSGSWKSKSAIGD